DSVEEGRRRRGPTQLRRTMGEEVQEVQEACPRRQEAESDTDEDGGSCRRGGCGCTCV
ncbi:hypothetical protein LTR53_016182, partial [Teratosphaeriaceae sp. CCFEE 6253]